MRLLGGAAWKVSPDAGFPALAVCSLKVWVPLRALCQGVAGVHGLHTLGGF